MGPRDFVTDFTAWLPAFPHARTHTRECASTCVLVCGPYCDARMSMRKYASSRFSRGICVSLSVWREKHCVKGQGPWARGPDRTDRTVSKDPFELDIPTPRWGTRDLGWIEQLSPANRFLQLSSKWQRTQRNLAKQRLIVLLILAQLEHHSRLNVYRMPSNFYLLW